MIDGPINFCPHCGTELVERFHAGKIRPSCPRCGWVYFPDPKVAVLILLRQDNKVLLVQRKYDPHKGLWTLPSGYVDAGEDPKAAAKRECLEETGLTIQEITMLDVIHAQEHPHGASILIVYRAEVESGELSPGDDANQVAYYPINNLPHLAFTSTQKILNMYF